MLVSSSAQVPSTGGSGSSLQKILEIQEEMVLIDKHKREHLAINNDTDKSCVYCQRRQQLLGGNRALKAKKKIRTSNEIERSVDTSGKNGYVSVPKSWAGKRVKIILLDEKS
jgi:putative transposon-encoded protein